MNARDIRKKITPLVSVLAAILIIYNFPRTSFAFLGLLVFCGIYDFSRNGIFDMKMFKKYFVDSGRNTWLLSPVNTFFDLLSKPNRHIYTLQDLPSACREDLQEVIDNAMEHKNEIIQYLDARMANNKRGMLFFQWYGRNIDNELTIPELHKKRPYIKTVGVSVFNENQSTSFHFGPLRLMYRVLYNIAPAPHHEGVYIQVCKTKHYWHDNPLFIFDDTLLHASFNKNTAKRYCLFIDIVRPSYVPFVLHGLISSFAGVVFTLRRFFYKNWKMIQ